MIGLVLWYNPDAQVGIFWCEDQGPLAYLAPEVELPEGIETLGCGDQVTFSVELRDDVRYVRDLVKVTPGVAGTDPREIIAGYHRTMDANSTTNLRIVA